MSWNFVTTTAALSPNSTKEFTIESEGRRIALFIVYRDQQYFVYENRCPHAGVNLNWQPDQFFDIEGQFIQCATHGALFRVTDGYCVRGPCAGARLNGLQFKIQNDDIYVRAR